jgi:DNA mismatch endonuclease (patch repair protein)
MRANRRTDTKPELALRHALHRLGYRYRKDYRLDLAGGRRVRPDIAFTARKVAVFVDGCFWHACPEHGSKPRANQWYWGPKLIKNVERDRINDAALILAGWTVVRLWEHVPLDEAVAAVVAALTANGAPTANGATSESSARDTSNAVATSSAVGQDQPGQDQPGYDQAGYDQAGYDQAGYDLAGPRESPAAGDDSLS